MRRVYPNEGDRYIRAGGYCICRTRTHAVSIADPSGASCTQEHPVLLSTPSALETRLVVYSRRGSQGIALLETMLQLPLFRLVAPDAVDIETAYTAFTQYGKGSGHPAGLNFGDLFSYALAKTRRLPLLFKGDDFSQTDIVSAWQPT